MVKMSEVAKAAGVSTATVSRALSNPETVKPSTRERILQAVEELDYRPNALARQLRTQETKTVIVIVPNLENPLFAEAILGIEADVERYYLTALRERQIDGIISMSAAMAQKILKEVAEEYPLVMAFQSFEDNRIPSVSVDNPAAARDMTTHLIRVGRRRIAHITGYAPLSVYRERAEGYLATLAEHDLDANPDWIRRGEATLQGGFEQAEALLALGERPDAIFCAGDTMAMGAIKALKKHGLRVPEDVAIVGFDDIGQAAFWDPALTTIRQPKQQIGETAFRKLYSLIRKERLTSPRAILPYELVIRESCGYFL